MTYLITASLIVLCLALAYLAYITAKGFDDDDDFNNWGV